MLRLVAAATALLALLSVGPVPVVAAPAPEPHDKAAAGLRLRVPRIGADAAIIPVGTTRAGHLAIGTSVTAVYRWRDGVLPGRPGSAVLAGHTWSRGDGVFDRLGSMRRGDRFSVGRHRFRVTRVARVHRMSRAQVAALFSDRGRARAVLITCGDRSNTTGVYATRILVFANLV